MVPACKIEMPGSQECASKKPHDHTLSVTTVAASLPESTVILHVYGGLVLRLERLEPLDKILL